MVAAKAGVNGKPNLDVRMWAALAPSLGNARGCWPDRRAPAAGHEAVPRAQLAVADASNARMTVTLIWPGKVISSEIWLAISVDISTTARSSTSRSRT